MDDYLAAHEGIINEYSFCEVDVRNLTYFEALLEHQSLEKIIKSMSTFSKYSLVDFSGKDAERLSGLVDGFLQRGWQRLDSLISYFGNMDSEDKINLWKEFHQDNDLGHKSIQEGFYLVSFFDWSLGIGRERLEKKVWCSQVYKSFWKQEQVNYGPTDPFVLRSLYHAFQPSPGQVVWDLGCGYGHPSIYGAINYPDVLFKGVELLPQRVNTAKKASKRLGLENVEFHEGNVLDIDFSDGDYFFAFNPFYPKTSKAVIYKLDSLAEEKPVMAAELFKGFYPGGNFLIEDSRPEAHRLRFYQSKNFGVPS